MAADLSSLLSPNATAAASVDALGSIQQGLQTGIQLATTADQIQKSKNQLEEQKQDLAQKKLNTFTGMIKSYSTMAPAVAKRARATMEQQSAMLGTDMKPIFDIMDGDEEAKSVLQLVSGNSDYMKSRFGNDPQGGISALQGLVMNAHDYPQAIADLKKDYQEFLNKRDQASYDLKKTQVATSNTLDKETRKALADSKVKFDSLVKKDVERASAASDAMQLLNSGSAIAGEAAKSKIARLSGEVGVLTDADVSRFGGSKALSSKLEAFAQQAYDGKLTGKNLAELKTIVAAFDRTVKNSINTQVERQANAYSKIYSVPVEQVKDILGADLYNKAPETPVNDRAMEAAVLSIKNGANVEDILAKAAANNSKLDEAALRKLVK